MLQQSIIRAALAAAILWVATPAHATTLYDSGTNSQTPPQSGLGMSGSSVAANSFSLSNDATLSSVTFDILECCTQSWSGSITYYLFTNNNFEPSSTPFAQGTTSAYNHSTIYSDSATNVVTEIDFNLLTPVALSAATTYWIGLNLSPNGSDPGWNAVVPYSGLSARAAGGDFGNWELEAERGAFALYNTKFTITSAVPEPSTAWPLLALFSLAGLRRILRTRAGIAPPSRA